MKLSQPFTCSECIAKKTIAHLGLQPDAIITLNIVMVCHLLLNGMVSATGQRSPVLFFHGFEPSGVNFTIQ